MSIRSNANALLRKFENDFTTHNRIEVSRSALRANLELFSNFSGIEVIPVLKGNAYGHGIVQVATALKDRRLPYIAVDGYFEALRIREISSQPVLVMGSVQPENFKRMKYDGFAFVVQDEASIHALGKTKKRIKLHLECNTGMNRYGADPDEIGALAKLILSYKKLELEGVMSHLADSDGDDPATVDTAVARYDACVEAVRATGANPTILHVAQSAGSMKAKSRYANTIRLGLGLYGINPFPPGHELYDKLQKELRPALRLISTITKVTNLEKGDKVSYNYTYTAPKKMIIGVLPIGYYEGAWTLSRGVGKQVGMVQVGGIYAPIVGRVCMNHMMVSLDGLNAKVGNEVVIYSNIPGDNNSVDSIAQEYGLFSYAMLTSLSSDVRRILVD